MATTILAVGLVTHTETTDEIIIETTGDAGSDFDSEVEALRALGGPPDQKQRKETGGMMAFTYTRFMR